MTAIPNTKNWFAKIFKLTTYLKIISYYVSNLKQTSDNISEKIKQQISENDLITYEQIDIDDLMI